MARIRKIQRLNPNGKNYYLVDSCFLANKHIAPRYAPAGNDRQRIEACLAWWKEIDEQVERSSARVYVPDVCIAEAFKVLAKKYYDQHWFPRHRDWEAARNALSRDVRTHNQSLKAPVRFVPLHDLSTNRDIIIGVDRFFETFLKSKDTRSVSVPDLIVLATAKYLMEFYDVPKERLHIVTMDAALLTGTRRMSELPRPYDPTQKGSRAELVFV
jgi:hypothetical protein